MDFLVDIVLCVFGRLSELVTAVLDVVVAAEEGVELLTGVTDVFGIALERV